MYPEPVLIKNVPLGSFNFRPPHRQYKKTPDPFSSLVEKKWLEMTNPANQNRMPLSCNLRMPPFLRKRPPTPFLF